MTTEIDTPFFKRVQKLEEEVRFLKGAIAGFKMEQTAMAEDITRLNTDVRNLNAWATENWKASADTRVTDPAGAPEWLADIDTVPVDVTLHCPECEHRILMLDAAHETIRKLTTEKEQMISTMRLVIRMFQRRIDILGKDLNRLHAEKVGENGSAP